MLSGGAKVSVLASRVYIEERSGLSATTREEVKDEAIGAPKLSHSSMKPTGRPAHGNHLGDRYFEGRLTARFGTALKIYQRA